jgi:hypothetical protein
MTRNVTAWGALVLGTLWAGLGNVAHASGDPLAMAWSGALPVALLVSLVLLLQRRGTWHAWLGAALVALVSFAVSYGHQFALLTAHGEGLAAYLGPLAPDGLVAVATSRIMSTWRDAPRHVIASPAASGWRVTSPRHVRTFRLARHVTASPGASQTASRQAPRRVTSPRQDRVTRTASPVVLAAEVTRLRADGVTWPDVARHLGVSVATAQRAVKSPAKN